MYAYKYQQNIYLQWNKEMDNEDYIATYIAIHKFGGTQLYITITIKQYKHIQKVAIISNIIIKVANIIKNASYRHSSYALMITDKTV